MSRLLFAWLQLWVAFSKIRLDETRKPQDQLFGQIRDDHQGRHQGNVKWEHRPHQLPDRCAAHAAAYEEHRPHRWRTQADAQLECTIVSFTDAPSILGAGENVEQRRVTITVQVIYKDLVKKVNVFDNNFTNYGDYKPGTVANERVVASEVAVEKISEDILLAVVSGW